VLAGLELHDRLRVQSGPYGEFGLRQAGLGSQFAQPVCEQGLGVVGHVGSFARAGELAWCGPRRQFITKSHGRVDRRPKKISLLG
jgi:hypothetical protein